MRRFFLASLLGLMSLHLGAVLFLSSLRAEGPSRALSLSSTSGALVLFGKNSMNMTVYKLFNSWSDLEAHLRNESLELPPLVEVVKLPPAYISVQPIAPLEARGSAGEHKILWSQTGRDHYVIHTPDPQSAEVLRNYVYYHGLKNSHLGFSIPISEITP
jgi:hypothetical protein